jgi:uncharacterized protein YjdB
MLDRLRYIVRFSFIALLLIGLTLPFTSCTKPSGLDSIAVAPATQALTVGQTVQFTVTGSFGNAKDPSTQSLASGITWTSSSPSVASVSAAGLATAVAAGTTTITATAAGFSGPVSSSATLTVTAGTGGTGGTENTDVISIAILPGSQSVAVPGQKANFIAIGTMVSGATKDVTSLANWSSSSVSIASAPVLSPGGSGVSPSVLVNGVSQGTATITAVYTNPDNTVATGVATFTVVGGSAQAYTALTVTPATQTLSAGQTGNFIAYATLGSTGLTEDVTDQVTWTSSIPSVASVTSGLPPSGTGTHVNGIGQGVSAGQSTITAQLTNPASGTTPSSVVTNSASLTVTATPAPEPLLSLTILPSTLSVGNLQSTGDFLAIGTYSQVPYVRDLTNSVKWISSFPDDFPVSTSSGTGTGTAGGIVTAYGNGTAVIIAEATSSDGTIQTATATFNCPLVLPNPKGDPPTPGSCFPGSETASLNATITVYNEGLNATGWEVTAPSATGTPNVIHCGPGWALGGGAGGSVCSAEYPIGTTVILTAPALSGVNFGGWSSSCSTISPNPATATGPNTCTVVLAGANPNVSIGAIFN